MIVYHEVFYDWVENQFVIISSPITYINDYEFIRVGKL